MRGRANPPTAALAASIALLLVARGALADPLPQPDAASSQPATAASQPGARPDAQLEIREQALGWWLGGSGTVAMLAGAFMLLTANGPSRDRAREIEFSGGVALGGLGAALLGAGIFTLIAAAPGPCETSGTALSARPQGALLLVGGSF